MKDLIERLEGLIGPDARIVGRLDRSGDCWLWTGALDDRGRGRVWYNGKNKIHHRAVWEILMGEIPIGALLCHHCDNPTCANPSHLYVGDAKSNAADMMERGRHWTSSNPGYAKVVDRKTGKTNTHFRGSGNPKAKLTPDQVDEISRSSAGPRELGKRYGVHRTTIQRIRKGAAWQNQ